MSQVNFNPNKGAGIYGTNPDTTNNAQDTEKTQHGRMQRGEGVKESGALLTQLLSAVLTTTTEGAGKKGKINDPTSMSNVLALPIGKGLEDIDLAKLLSLLQMETSEEQLKLAQERIKQLKDLIAARCNQQLGNIQKSVEAFKKAEEKRKAALITAWATLALAVAALAATIVCSVLSLGLGAGAIVAASVAVAAAAASVVMLSKPSLMNKLIGGIADVFQAIDPSMSRKEAKKAAQIAMLAVTVAVTLASLAFSFGNPATITSAIGRLIQAGTAIATGALGMVSGGINIAATVDNYRAAMAQVELKKIQQFLEKLEERLQNEQDAIQDIMKMLQDCVSGIMQQINSVNQIEQEIFMNLGQSMA